MHIHSAGTHTHTQTYLVSVEFSGISKLHFKFNFLDTELLVQMKMCMDFGVCDIWYINLQTYMYACTVNTYVWKSERHTYHHTVTHYTCIPEKHSAIHAYIVNLTRPVSSSEACCSKYHVWYSAFTAFNAFSYNKWTHYKNYTPTVHGSNITFIPSTCTHIVTLVNILTRVMQHSSALATSSRSCVIFCFLVFSYLKMQYLSKKSNSQIYVLFCTHMPFFEAYYSASSDYRSLQHTYPTTGQMALLGACMCMQ